MKFPNLLRLLWLSLLSFRDFISTGSPADHGPERMWKRQIKPYFKAHETGMLGPFKVNVESFGRKMHSEVKQTKNRISTNTLTMNTISPQ